MQIWIDLIGWLGSVALITAFVLNSAGRITAQTLLYQGLNVFGGIALIVNTYYYGAYPSTVVNVVWLFIAGYYLLKMRRRGKPPVRPEREPSRPNNKRSVR